VMLTSLTDNDTVIEAIQAGANDYVVKPYTSEIITERVECGLRVDHLLQRRALPPSEIRVVPQERRITQGVRGIPVGQEAP